MQLRVIAVLTLLAILMTGCAVPQTTTDLNGTSWRLEAWSVSAINPADHEITAQFEDGQIGDTSAGNTYRGPYTTTSAGEFKVGELVSTKMAGSEAAMQAETTYLELLGQVRRYSLSGDTLSLLDNGGNELLVFAQE